MNLRKIDALIAKHVMGLRSPKHGTYIDDVCPFDGTVTTYPIPHYSSYISAAWEVVEKIMEGYEVSIESVAVDPQDQYYNKTNQLQWTVILQEHYLTTTAAYLTGTDLPLTLCLAILKAKGVDYE